MGAGVWGSSGLCLWGLLVISELQVQEEKIRQWWGLRKTFNIYTHTHVSTHEHKHEHAHTHIQHTHT